MKNKINLHYLYVLLAASLWGCAGIFVRNLEESSGKMEMVFGRVFFTSLILAIIIFIKDRQLFKIKIKDIWIFISAGIFSIVLFNFSYYTTMSLSTLSVAAVLLYTAPFFVVFLSFVFFGFPITVKKVFACVVAFFGCMMVSGFFDNEQKISTEALFFGLLTGFGYALYTIFGDMLIRRGYKTLTITFYIFFFATFGTLPFINLYNTISTATRNEIFWTFLMAVFNTVLPYILYTKGLFGVDPTVAPIIATVEPVVATLVGTFIFKEHLTVLGVIGILLTLFSVALLNLKNKNIITLKVNAKINLSLYITGKRNDGYHSIDTVMQSVSLFDTVKVKKSQTLSLTCSESDLSGENNIAFKAARLFFEQTGISAGADIHIKKHIPQAGGMGGGSADAAAVLVALNKLYKTDLSYKTLEKIASLLGADVPFFIKGGTVRATGIGEILKPLAPLSKGYFVIAKEGTKPSTKEMYNLLDSKPQEKIDIDSSVKFAQSEDLENLGEHFFNSFNSVWEDKGLENRLKSFNPLGVGLSGSGPTYFALFKNKPRAKHCEKALKSANITAFTVKPVKNSISFE